MIRLAAAGCDVCLFLQPHGLSAELSTAFVLFFSSFYFLLDLFLLRGCDQRRRDKQNVCTVWLRSCAFACQENMNGEWVSVCGRALRRACKEIPPQRESLIFARVCCWCVLCALVCVCVWVSAVRGRMGESEGEKMQSSACWSGLTIQHREKPFIQHRPHRLSYQATLDGSLNGLAGMAATTLPPPTPTPPLVSALSQTLFVLHSFLLSLILPIFSPP